MFLTPAPPPHSWYSYYIYDVRTSTVLLCSAALLQHVCAYSTLQSQSHTSDSAFFHGELFSIYLVLHNLVYVIYNNYFNNLNYINFGLFLRYDMNLTSEELLFFRAQRLASATEVIAFNYGLYQQLLLLLNYIYHLNFLLLSLGGWVDIVTSIYMMSVPQRYYSALLLYFNMSVRTLCCWVSTTLPWRITLYHISSTHNLVYVNYNIYTSPT